jgi:hypothetical protein
MLCQAGYNKMDVPEDAYVTVEVERLETAKEEKKHE